MSKQYRAVVGMTLPEDSTEADRLIRARDSGSPIPFAERKLTRVEPGELVTFIPEISLPWLLEQGLIEEEEADE